MNVLLDLDGTLTDPKEGIVGCIEHVLGSLGYSAPAHADLARFIGPPLRDSFIELLATEDDTVIDVAIKCYRDRFRDRGIYENKVYDGIPQALEELCRSGARLFVATSKPRVFAERILDHFGLAAHFAAVHGSELDGTRSNKAELIAHVLSSEKLQRADTVMVGDRYHDALGAITNGVVAAGVLWGYGTRYELLQAGVRQLLEHPEELRQLVI